MNFAAEITGQARQWLALGQTQLGEQEARSWLKHVVPFSEALSCTDLDGALESAGRLGYPVVAKIMGPSILHKAELGLVRTDIRGPAELELAWRDLDTRAIEARLQSWSISIQPMLAGFEIGVGIRRDALGAVCTVAAGGPLIEIVQDMAAGLAPLDLKQATELIKSLRMSKVLEGYREHPPADLPALASLVTTISELADQVHEIAELDLNPVFVNRDGCRVADASCVLAPAPEPVAKVLSSGLTRLLKPRRVAVIGGTNDERKVGGMILKYLSKHKFGGEVVSVNTRNDSNGDFSSVRTLAEIEGSVDLACIAVPASRVEQVIGECVRKEIGAAIVYSSGFAETGPEGVEAQFRLGLVAGDKLRILGPNSMGLVVPRDNLYATFGMASEREAISGHVGLISQSGAIASSLVSRSKEFGLGFSHWISVGNEADLSLEDFVNELASDDSCRVICLFVETIRHPSAFAVAMEKALRSEKPVLVVKAGLSEAGSAAAASHTGAMTSSDLIYDAFFDRHGVMRVPDLEALMVSAQGVLSAGAVGGPRVGIISMSGGACSLIADACSIVDLSVPTFDEEVQFRLAQVLPPFASTKNPVDVTAAGIQHPNMVREALSILRQSGEVDLILIQLSTNADPAAAEIASDLVEERSGGKGVPFIVGRLGSVDLAPRAMQIYEDAGMHVFTWPEQLVRAAAASVAFGSILARARHKEPR